MKDDARAGIGLLYLARAVRRLAKLKTETMVLTDEDIAEMERVAADIQHAEAAVKSVDQGAVGRHQLEED